MSQGTTRVTLRVPPVYLDQMDAIIARTADSRDGEPWNRSTWILQAIRDKLAHMERSRKWRRKKPQPATEAA